MLALALGEPSPSMMLHKMTASEYRGWLAYNMIEPIGPIRHDMNAANIIDANARLQCGSKYKGQMEDYMLEFENRFLTDSEIADKKRKRTRRGSGTIGELHKVIKGQ